MSGRTRALAAMLATSSAVGGCSAIFIDRPPRSPVPGAPVACTESRVAPFVDTYVGGLAIIGSVALAVKPCNNEDFGCIGKLALLPLVPAAIAYSASAIWGHVAVSECRQLRAYPLGFNPALVPAPGAPGSAPARMAVSWRFATVVAPSVDAHSAPYQIAPLLARMGQGGRVSVSNEMGDGWRLVALPDGRVGYLRDADVRLDPLPVPVAPAAPVSPAPVVPVAPAPAPVSPAPVPASP